MTEEMREKIQAALGKLDHSNPEHWIKSGQPDLNVLQGIVGAPKTRDDVVTRKMLAEVAPGYVRQVAQLAAPDAPKDATAAQPEITEQVLEEPHADSPLQNEQPPEIEEGDSEGDDLPAETVDAIEKAVEEATEGEGDIPAPGPNVLDAAGIDVAAIGAELRQELSQGTREVVVHADALEHMHHTLDVLVQRVRDLERENNALREQNGRVMSRLRSHEAELAKYGRSPLDRSMSASRGHGIKRPRFPVPHIPKS